MSQFKNYLKQFDNKKVNIYVDMDGVVADFDMLGYMKEKNNPDVYLYKRPVKAVIDALKEVSELDNVNINILSVSGLSSQVNGKLVWLEKEMSFINSDNINIIAKDKYDSRTAASLKKEFLEEHIKDNEINIMIDDSHDVLYTLFYDLPKVIPLHTTSIID